MPDSTASCKLDGLFDGDERADVHVGQALDGLDDDLDVFALLVRAGEERQVAQFGQHAAQFRLENDQHRHGEKRRERAEQPAQHLQIQQRRHQRQRQQHDDEADDHRPAARAAHESGRRNRSAPRGSKFPARAARHPECESGQPSISLPGQHRFRHPHRLHGFRHVVRADDLHARCNRQTRAGQRRRQACSQFRAEQFSDERLARNAEQQRTLPTL